jgi:hypothetical protein
MPWLEAESPELGVVVVGFADADGSCDVGECSTGFVA